MNELYVLVDLKENTIISPLMELPSDWANINGLNLFPKDKIKNLSWAGHENLGWISFSDKNLSEFSAPDQWLEMSKLKLKSIISAQRWEKENEVLTFKGKQLKIDERTKVSLSFKITNLKDTNETVVWKFMNGLFEIDFSELIELYDFINSYIQDCFNVEYDFSNLVNSAQTKDDLSNLNLNLNWPNNSI